MKNTLARKYRVEGDKLNEIFEMSWSFGHQQKFPTLEYYFANMVSHNHINTKN